jgi:hypothetical protein
VAEGAIDYHSDRAVAIGTKRQTCICMTIRGDTVARAKGTDRAEARRRYRAIVKAQEEAEAGTEGQATAAAPGVRNRGRGSQALKPAPSPVAQQPGFFGAAKAAYRPVHYREDLGSVVPLITRTHAVWPVLVMTIVAVPLALALPKSTDSFALAAILFILNPTPLLPSMIAGFLAPRATWLLGAINAFIAGTGFVILALLADGQIPGLIKISVDQTPIAFIQVISFAVPFGAILAAGTGWYKRFLAAMPGSGPRQQRRKAK